MTFRGSCIHTNSAFAVALICASCFSSTVQADDKIELPDEIQKALERQGKELSPISVQYTHKFQSVGHTNTEALSLFHMTNRNPKIFYAARKKSCKWQDGSIYDSHENPQADGPSVFVEDSYDGSTSYLGQHNPENKTLIKQSSSNLSNNSPDGLLADTLYFENAGIHVPCSYREMGHKDATSQILKLLNDGGDLKNAGNIQIDGKQVFQVQVTIDNPETIADKNLDLNRVKQETADSKDSREEQELYLSTLEKLQNTPVDKLRIVFHLDPKNDYAVQQWEYSE